MKIEVLTRDAKQVTILQNISPTETIAEIKKKIHQAKATFYPERQELRLDPKGKGLKDEVTLESLGFHNDANIYLKDLGPQIGWRTLYLIEYAGPFLIYLIFYQRPRIFYGFDAEEEFSRAATIAAFCWTFHYTKRLFESAFVHRFSRSTMPFNNIYKNCTFYYVGAVTIGYKINNPKFISPPITQVYLFMIFFFISEIGNLSIHLALMNLRPVGTKVRAPPMPNSNPLTLMFNYVSCPHYFYEFTSWLSFAFMTCTIETFIFCLLGGMIMSKWALARHEAYRKEFKDYPKSRKAIFPFIL